MNPNAIDFKIRPHVTFVSTIKLNFVNILCFYVRKIITLPAFKVHKTVDTVTAIRFLSGLVV